MIYLIVGLSPYPNGNGVSLPQNSLYPFKNPSYVHGSDFDYRTFKRFRQVVEKLIGKTFAQQKKYDPKSYIDWLEKNEVYAGNAYLDEDKSKKNEKEFLAFFKTYKEEKTIICTGASAYEFMEKLIKDNKEILTKKDELKLIPHLSRYDFYVWRNKNGEFTEYKNL